MTVGHAGGRRSRRVPGRDLQRPGEPHRAGVRPGDPHGRNGNRSAEPRLPPEARHVRARPADGLGAPRCDHGSEQRRRDGLPASPACSSPVPRRPRRRAGPHERPGQPGSGGGRRRRRTPRRRPPRSSCPSRPASATATGSRSSRACATACRSSRPAPARSRTATGSSRPKREPGQGRGAAEPAVPQQRERPMSIPRTAIQRPVTMFMLSGVIILLGMLSLFRLPVDLMPDVSYPSLTVRVALSRRRPARNRGAHHAPHRAGDERGRRPRAARVDRAGRLQPDDAELRLGHRPERSGRRRAQPARSRARPAARGSRRAGDVQVRLERHADHGRRRRGASRGSRSRDAPRDGRARPLAAARARAGRGVGQRRGRPAPADSRRALQGEGPRARPAGRPDHRPAPLGEPEHPRRRNRRRRHDVPGPQPGTVREPRSKSASWW